ncbi:MAG: phenylalanine--tRNA ligase subunit alpha, partial [Pseudomonadota bacterium]|nr:phenylalanine--tRNA ligase subunit alpha [Pseudomonadota bacterium]
MQNLDELSSEILNAVASAETLEALEAVRIDALGKKGRVSLMMRELGGMDPEARKAAGQELNKVKDNIAAAIETRQTALSRGALDARLAAEAVDVSLPSRPEAEARLHPLSRTIEEVVAIFAEMGFTVAEGPDIESDFYNFTALNIPEEHPARQEHDTFYLPPDDEGRRKVLRTHTSPVQIRTMEATEPPIRIIVPGRTYRSDHDATHSPMFHQCEGLVIG